MLPSSSLLFQLFDLLIHYTCAETGNNKNEICMIQLLRFTRRHYRFEHAVDTISFISYHAENNLIIIIDKLFHRSFCINISTCLCSAHKLVKK